MKVLIIEDEVAAFNNLRDVLYEIDQTIEILGNPDTVVGSVEWFRTHEPPDLVFMDIQLADGSSFLIFDRITIDAPIVFTTAYDEHALQAFRVNSIDYILKPITRESIRGALGKFERLNRVSVLQINRNLQDLLETKEYLQRVLVPVNDQIIPIKTNDIAYLYNTGGNTSLATLSGEAYNLDKSLDAVMARLDPSAFFRANRQFIVSKEAIESISVWFDNRLLIRLVVTTPERIYIAKNKAVTFKIWFSGDKFQ